MLVTSVPDGPASLSEYKLSHDRGSLVRGKGSDATAGSHPLVAAWWDRICLLDCFAGIRQVSSVPLEGKGKGIGGDEAGIPRHVPSGP